MMLTDDQLEKFKRSNTFKMLVKGSYLGVMENSLKNMTKKQLVDECFKKEAQIFDLKDKLALTEKALELACEDMGCEECPLNDVMCVGWGDGCKAIAKILDDDILIVIERFMGGWCDSTPRVVVYGENAREKFEEITHQHKDKGE